MSDIYSKIAQEYLHYQSEQRNLIKQRERINAKLDLIDEIMNDLNDILCKWGGSHL